MKRALLAALLCACTHADPPGPTPEAASSAAAAPALGSAAAPVASAVDPAAAPSLTAFVATRAKLVGHTSLVLKLEGDAKQRAIFRPAFHEGGTRYRGEIAAYRLGVRLGLGALFAEAVPHSMPKETARALLSVPDRAKFDADAIVEGNQVHGALVRWIDGLEMPPFEKDPWVARWKGWIQTPVDIPAADRPLAAQFSTLVAFDYLTGNFDRWSGGNVGAVKRGESFDLRFIDNDGAFLDPMPKGPLAASRERLLATTRFDVGFVEKLRALTKESSWAGVFGSGVDGKPLLSATVADGVRTRAVFALDHIDKKGDASHALP